MTSAFPQRFGFGQQDAAVCAGFHRHTGLPCPACGLCRGGVLRPEALARPEKQPSTQNDEEENAQNQLFVSLIFLAIIAQRPIHSITAVPARKRS